MTRIYLAVLLAFTLACGDQAKDKENETSQKQLKEKSEKDQQIIDRFLADYNNQYQELYTKSGEAQWTTNTRIVEGDTASTNAAQRADQVLADFLGNKQLIYDAKNFLKRDDLTILEQRQLNAILYNAGNSPAIAGDIVKQRIAAENKQTELLFGYRMKLDGKPIDGNEINQILIKSTDLEEREKAWAASKEVGTTLKDGLVKLRRLRNQSVQLLDYEDYFDYQISAYGMTKQEMINECEQMIKEMWPLYRELHTWARYTLAEKYNEEVPEMLPAHWLPNKWGQEWSAMLEIEGVNLDQKLEEKGAEWIVKEGERFYQSMGFDTLPASFYELSSLYPASKDANYTKNSHASAWHINLKKDVRSLMSIVPNTQWWGTTLHELGHIYYYLEYANPEVPYVLREGANRAYHEAMGSLMGLASMQKPFLIGRGLMNPNTETDEMQQLLKEALDYVVLIPWGAGVMTQYEYQLYANELPEGRLNHFWWRLKEKYQGIVPPTPRGEEFTDAASKTHINNDAAQYYDYALSNVLLFQFHDHIAKNILKQDPHATNYYGSKATGDFIKSLMVNGGNVDWREDLQSKLGSGMSAKAMAAYFAPLMDYLREENKGRAHTLRENI